MCTSYRVQKTPAASANRALQSRPALLRMRSPRRRASVFTSCPFVPNNFARRHDALFPSSQRRGGRDLNKISRSLLWGADGVVRSAKRCAALTTITASPYRARLRRFGGYAAFSCWRSPLLCEGNNIRDGSSAVAANLKLDDAKSQIRNLEISDWSGPICNFGFRIRDFASSNFKICSPLRSDYSSILFPSSRRGMWLTVIDRYSPPPLEKFSLRHKVGACPPFSMRILKPLLQRLSV